MAGIKVQIKGFDEFRKRLQNHPKVVAGIGTQMQLGAEKIRAAAIKEAPSGAGHLLRDEIGKSQLDETSWGVFSNAKYSGFVEFGTGKHVVIPAGLEETASELKKANLGGTAEEALNSIMNWVRIKGIRFDSAATFKSGKKKGQNKKLTVEQTAYVIFHFIMLNGIKPHPFFFKQLDTYSPEILKSVENELNKV